MMNGMTASGNPVRPALLSCLILGIGLWGQPSLGRAEERRLDFSLYPEGQTPPGFRSILSGEGAPGVWKIRRDEVPDTLAPLTPNATGTNRRAVLAQESRDPTDERFPILIYEEEKFADFKLTVRFKPVEGEKEQMAGLAFRLQDEKNYYVVRASSLGSTFRFYPVVNGLRGAPIGKDIRIPAGQWHTMGVECKGNQIKCFLNGEQVLPTITDLSFSQGMVGFWTKSDSVSYFTDAVLDFTPLESLAEVLVRELTGRYPRVIGLRICGPAASGGESRVLASTVDGEKGAVASKIEREVIETDGIGYLKTKEQVIVTLPIHDRNGEPAGSLQVTMEPFPGQTRDNAIARATPIAEAARKRVRSGRELWQ